MDNSGLVLRMTYGLIAFCLAWSAALELHKPEGPLWTLVMAVPSVFTVVVACNIQIADRLILKSVMSVYMGCTLSLFIGLLIYFSAEFVRHRTLISMADPESDEYIPPSLANRGKQCLLLFGIISWVKFLTATTRQMLRFENIGTDSPRRMLLQVALLLAAVFGAIAFVWATF